MRIRTGHTKCAYTPPFPKTSSGDVYLSRLMTRINTIDMLVVEINNKTETHRGNMNLLFRIPSTANGITKVIDKAAIVFEIIVKYLYDWKTLTFLI